MKSESESSTTVNITTPVPEDWAEEIIRLHKRGSQFSRHLAYFCCFAILLLSAITGWALYDRFHQTNQNRGQIQQVWHAVICAIERQILANPQADLDQKRAAIKFYDSLLTEQVGAESCGLTVPTEPK